MKNAYKLFFIAVLIFSAIPASSCECKVENEDDWSPVVEKYLTQSPIIFLGKMMFSRKDDIKVKVVDVFKGNIEVDTTVMVDSDIYCSGLPSKGLIIFYASRKNDSVLQVGTCGISRGIGDFNFKQFSADSNESPQPDERIFNWNENAHSALLLKNWMIEYALLNAYRNNHPKVVQAQTSKSDYFSYLAVALSFIAVLVAFFRKQR